MPIDADTLFLLRFDGDVLAHDGAATTGPPGTLTFDAGIAGQALYVADGVRLNYLIAGHLLGPVGTIQMWIKPDWNGTDNSGHFFLQAAGPFNLGMEILIDGAPNLRFIRWGDDVETPSVESDVERGVGSGPGVIQAGTWIHFAYTWEESDMTFYVDGTPVGSIADAVLIDEYASADFSVGSSRSGGAPLLGYIDELRISGRARSAAEILDDYQRQAP
ncbi:MAG: hypothetical protein A2138_20980 [Deltaproteobacteria bacterium RBG_16_71_12]|nr:MAG: hypothetical protein A2138_20980 [Deltaproteobacteria bacterium RBG_16_71_12]